MRTPPGGGFLSRQHPVEARNISSRAKVRNNEMHKIEIFFQKKREPKNGSLYSSSYLLNSESYYDKLTPRKRSRTAESSLTMAEISLRARSGRPSRCAFSSSSSIKSARLSCGGGGVSTGASKSATTAATTSSGAFLIAPSRRSFCTPLMVKPSS
jgi:hypothetical protein